MKVTSPFAMEGVHPMPVKPCESRSLMLITQLKLCSVTPESMLIFRTEPPMLPGTFFTSAGLARPT